jgi:cytosine/adenosine deaminase-related metal-dependent hydrolase
MDPLSDWAVEGTAVFAGADDDIRAGIRLTIKDGLISALAPAGLTTESGRRFILPSPINAHDHARPAASSFGAMNRPLETWILQTVLGTPPDPYLQAAVSLARSARSGCAAVMVHYTRPSGRMPIVDEAAEIARAAKDVGVRLAFALSVRDQNPLVYGDAEPLLASMVPQDREVMERLFVHKPPAPRAYIDVIESIAARIGGPMVDVQLGPAGVQWCSLPLLEAIAAHSAATGRRIHMHLLETIYQRAWADQAFPQGIVRRLDEIGLLSDRLTLAHCVHARPEELELIASRGVRIVTNASSNMHLRSGLGPIAAAYRQGASIAVGIDGLALDEDDDIVREMRLVQLLHGGTGFKRTWSPAEFLIHAVASGRRATGAPGTGRLEVGAAADFIVIDLDRLDRDAILPVDPLDLLFARGNMSHIAESVVAGRSVVKNGVVAGVDLPNLEAELRRLYRTQVPRHADFQDTWRRVEPIVGRWFRDQCGCGC